jgi:hypothetical protein
VVESLKNVVVRKMGERSVKERFSFKLFSSNPLLEEPQCTQMELKRILAILLKRCFLSR